MRLIAWLDCLDERVLFRLPRLEEGERFVWCTRGNRTQGVRRTVGGTLCITDRRLIFTPNRAEALLGGQGWISSLSELRHVSVEKDERILGIAPHNLRIETEVGRELFLIAELEVAVERLTELKG